MSVRVVVEKALSRRALRAMTDEQLRELVKVDRNTIRIHKFNAIGHPGYYSSEFVKKEVGQAWYEIHAAEKILMRRRHVAQSATAVAA